MWIRVNENVLQAGTRIVRELGIKESIKTIIRYLDYNTGILKLRANNGLVLRKIQGNKMFLFVSDPGISYTLLVKGVHEKYAYEIMKKELKKGMVVLDVGANLGYYVLLEAPMVGEEGMIYALEPVPRNFRILNMNIKINNLRNIKTYCKAVSDRNGSGRMLLPSASNIGTMSDMNKASEYIREMMKSASSIKVPTTTIDDFLKKEGIDYVNMIRMDIEGYEIEAVNGMLKTLKNASHPLELFIEIHNVHFPDLKTSIMPMLEKILNLGFKPNYLIPRNQKPIKLPPRQDKFDFIKKVCSHRCAHVFLKKA